MIESEDKSLWPQALRRKDTKQMLDFCIRSKAEVEYGREVQTLCKTPGFGLISFSRPGEVNREPLQRIVEHAKFKAPMLTSLVCNVGPLTMTSNSNIISIKLVAIFVILCRLVHRNNNNYLPSLIVLYVYSAGTQTDAITLLNHLGVGILYNTFIRKLKGIVAETHQWTKQQSSNPKLVGTWDNFEYCKNVHKDRVDDKVKFRLITMAYWVKNGWRIFEQGLKQSIWNPKRVSLDAVSVFLNVLGDNAKLVRKKCIQHY